MKKLRTSLLPALLSILALCSFSSAWAENIDVQPSTENFQFYIQDHVQQTYATDEGHIFYWDTRCQPSDKVIFFGYNFADSKILDKIKSVRVYVNITEPDGSEGATEREIVAPFSPTSDKPGSFGSFADYEHTQAGTYTTNTYMEVTYNDDTSDTFHFGPFTYTLGKIYEKPKGTLTYTINENRCNFTVDITPGDYTLTGINVWAEAAGVRYYQLSATASPFTGTITVPVEAFGDNNTIEYYIKAEAFFTSDNGEYSIAGNDKTNMVGTDEPRQFTKPESSEPVDPVIPGLVKSVNSVDANISYTAAILDEGGNIVWNIPQTIKDQLLENETTQGISGRYIKIEPWKKNGEPTIWAPEIPYTIGNDEYGHLYITLDIPEDNLPDGFVPQLIINNNQENRDQNFHKNEDGKWQAISKYPYPNNSTISYYFRANFAEGGQIQTRTFGYKVENVTNETSEPYTLTTLAEAALGEGQVSGQIYICHAHDPSYPVKEEERGEGKWFRTARPADYANTTDDHGEFYFCPPFEYIIANDATAAASGDSKIFVAVKFPEYDGKTVIPTDFKPQVLIYDIDKAASTRAYNGIPEDAEVITLPMNHVAGMVNTYQTDINNTTKFPANKKLGVAFHYAYWSIVKGNGFSSTGPRTYVMSADNTVVTGIEETGADAEPAFSTVYNLQGIAVRVNVATDEALAGLPAGIYIVNGKKYAVK